VPNRWIELLIGLDDCEAGAGNLAFMAERGDQAPRQRGLADAERPRKRNHVARPRQARQLGAGPLGILLTVEDHRDPRGMVSVTVVPLPFFDSSSTVPP